MSTLPTIPDLVPGTVVTLRTEDWRYGGRPLRLRVGEVRHDLSRYYHDEWIWIVGEDLDEDGASRGQVEALVRVAALTRRSDQAAPRVATRTPARRRDR